MPLAVPRFAYLAGLTGLAITALVLVTPAGASWPAARLYAALFVLLGYALTRESQQVPRRPLQHLAQLLWRTVPAYYAALLATLLLVRVAPDALPPHAAPAFSSGGVLSHVLLVHNWFPRWKLLINPSLWAAAAGIQGCVLFALVLAPLRRWRGAPGVLAGGVLLGIAPLALAPERAAAANVWFIALIALGASAAARRELHTRWGLLSATLALACVLFGCLAPERALLGDTLAGLATASALACLDGPGTSSLGLRRVCESRALGALGRASYSILLTYLPVLTLCRAHAPGLILPALALVAAAFYFGIERHFLRNLRELSSYVRPARNALAVLLAVALTAACVERALERRDSAAVAGRGQHLVLGAQRIRYRLQRGAAALPTVVLLSAMGPLEEFDAVTAQLDPQLSVLSYDRCNMGWSRADTTGCTPQRAARELAQVLDALHIQRVLLIGYSVSALQVRAFVQAHRARVAGAIFIDPRSPEAIDAIAREVNWAGRRALDVWLGGKLLRTAFGYERAYRAYASPAPPDDSTRAQVSAKHAWAALRAFRAFESARSTDFDRTAFARVPAALISATDPTDRFGRLVLNAQEAAIERAPVRRVLSLHDVPHWELLNDARSARRIAEFIAEFVRASG